MKKLLLGTTALIGAAALASTVHAATPEPVAVTVGGYLQFDAGHVSEDRDNDDRSTDFRTSSEVHVRGEGTTDTGITYGAILELETDQNSTTNGDENHLYASSGWGKVELGDKRGVANTVGLFRAAPGDFGLGGVVAEEESYRDFLQNTPAAGVNDAELFGLLSGLFEAPNANKSTKATYYTPVWNGFQAGVSYSVANSSNTGTNTNRSEFTSQNTDTTTNPYNTEVDGLLEIAALYEAVYNNVSFALSGAYTRGDALDNTTAADEAEDLSSYALGAQVGFGGFTVGGSWVDAGDSFLATDITGSNNEDDLEGYTVGIQYETGPYVVGANYLHSQTENSTFTIATNDAKFDAFSIGGSYAAAPGWVAYAEYTDFEFDGGDTVGDTDENDGSVLILGTRVSF